MWPVQLAWIGAVLKTLRWARCANARVRKSHHIFRLDDFAIARFDEQPTSSNGNANDDGDEKTAANTEQRDSNNGKMLRVWHKVIEAIWVQTQFYIDTQLQCMCAVCVYVSTQSMGTRKKQPHIQNGFQFFLNIFVFRSLWFSIWFVCLVFSSNFFGEYIYIAAVAGAFFSLSSFYIIFTNEKLCLRMLSIRASSRI